MPSSSLRSIHILYTLAALYDGLLGLAFLIAAPLIYDFFGIVPPNHWGYVHFGASLLFVFGLMFLSIARDPRENRNLIVFGILLKVCYVATVGWHWVHGDIPAIWKFFAVIDVVFAIAFAGSWFRLYPSPDEAD